ncbi:MAG TPA: antitoxin [Lapillicoccus sp.]
MSAFDNMKNQGEDFLEQHGDQAGAGIDKAGDAIDERTGGEHSEQIDQGAQRAKDALGNLGGQDDAPES